MYDAPKSIADTKDWVFISDSFSIYCHSDYLQSILSDLKLSSTGIILTNAYVPYKLSVNLQACSSNSPLCPMIVELLCFSSPHFGSSWGTVRGYGYGVIIRK